MATASIIATVIAIFGAIVALVWLPARAESEAGDDPAGSTAGVAGGVEAMHEAAGTAA